MAEHFSGQTAGVIYQTGFEAPPFSPGTINGQDSWFINGASSSTVIETTTVETGVQAVGITPFGATGGVVGAISTSISTRVARFRSSTWERLMFHRYQSLSAYGITTS
jgi:hypothetical protein